MNTHHALAVSTHAICRFDLSKNIFNRTAREFIAEYVNTDFAIRCPVRVNRVNDAVDRVTVTERPPRSHRADDGLSTPFGVRYPLAGILLEHVLAVVIHNLHTLHLWVYVERLAYLGDGPAPVVLLHATGRIDDKNHVLAVDRYSGNSIVVRRTIVGLEANHLFGQTLLYDIQVAFVDEVLSLRL